MLFDLQGKRRRVVQATYLTLAVLMGGGLVLFGIGGDVSGGLFDAFSERNTGGDSNQALEDRIERNEKRAAAGGAAREPALQELVRDYFALAGSDINPETGELGDDARADLTKAAAAWQRYLKVEQENPSASTADYAVRIYDVTALNKPDEALEAAQIIAERRNDASAYLNVVKYATLAGNTRIADLAAAKALELAPKGERAIVKQNIEALKRPATPPAETGG